MCPQTIDCHTLFDWGLMTRHAIMLKTTLICDLMSDLYCVYF